MKISKYLLVVSFLVPLAVAACNGSDDTPSQPDSGTGGAAGNPGGNAGSGAGPADKKPDSPVPQRFKSECYTAPTKECLDCKDSKCGAVCHACLSDPDCKGLVSCRNMCEQADESCEVKCNAKYPNAVPAYFQYVGGFVNCADTRCGQVCGADFCTPGGALSDRTPCQKCRLTKCVDMCRTCIDGTDNCTEVYNCYERCWEFDKDPCAQESSNDCLQNCNRQYGSQAIGLFLDWLGRQGKCAAEPCFNECRPTCEVGASNALPLGAECAACNQAECMETCSTCMQHDGCLRLDRCINSCDRNNACIDECISKFGDGWDARKSWYSCLQEKCLAPCFLEKPKEETSCQAGVLGGGTCDICNCQNCFEECDACLQSPECREYRKCTKECKDNGMSEACINGCATRYPRGALLDTQWRLPKSGCLANKCKDECTGNCHSSVMKLTFGLDNGGKCDACNQEKCKSQCAAADSFDFGSMFITCSSDCRLKPTEAEQKQCREDCKKNHPLGWEEVAPWVGPNGCIAINCKTECAEQSP